MQNKDVALVHNLFTKYMAKYPVHFEMSVEEFRHFLMPKEGVIDSYVV